MVPKMLALDNKRLYTISTVEMGRLTLFRMMTKIRGVGNPAAKAWR
jgi:hypothetical protein